MPTLANLIDTFDDEVLGHICWAISYLSDGRSFDKTHALLETAIPRRLVELLTHSDSSIQVPALRSVGNITATDGDAPTQAIINCGALPALLSPSGL